MVRGPVESVGLTVTRTWPNPIWGPREELVAMDVRLDAHAPTTALLRSQCFDPSHANGRRTASLVATVLADLKRTGVIRD